MPDVTLRTLTNTGDPITLPDGTLLADTLLTFTLVDTIKHRPVSMFDVLSSEFIVGADVTVTTDVNGEFSIPLWPNVRGEIATVYKVIVDNDAVRPFYIRMPEGVGDCTFIQAKTELQTLTVQEASLLSTSLASAASSAVTSTEQAGIATAQASDASGSATAAHNSELATAADAVQTDLDKVQTGLDRIATGQDKTSTNADALATAADRVQTGLDKTAASGSATTATDKAGEAAASATTATSASTSLSAALLSFRATFLGHLAEDPTIDGNGDALMDGVSYVNTVSDKIRIYDLGTGTWSDYDAAAQTATANATLSAASAAGSAAAALTSEGTATTQAGIATTKAAEASVSAVAAEASAAEAATLVGQALEGAILGPVSSVSGNIALFDGVSGKLLKDGLVNTTDFAVSTHNHNLNDLTEKSYNSLTDKPTIPAAYEHPTGDGNLHVPPNNTTNAGKVLTAGTIAGTYSWETPVGGLAAEAKTSSFTATKYKRYVCDTSTAAFTCTLPSTPDVGDYIEFQDSGSTWTGNALTIARNGLKINGALEDFVCNVNDVQVSLTYVSAAFGWHVTLATSSLEAAPHATGSHSDWPAAVTMVEVGYLDGVTSGIQEQLADKQTTLVSGTNIKTINGETILGAGDIAIAAGTGVTVSGTLTLYATQSTTLTITNYDSATTYSVSVSAGTASITGDTITYTAGSIAGTPTLTITAGASTRDITINVNAAGVAQPTNTSPTTGAADQSGPTLALTASAFEWVGLTDTHASSDWELATDSGFTTIVDSSYADTTNKTTWTADVVISSTYYWRVRYIGASGRVSAWSAPTSFSTKANFGGMIGTAGAQGFGVGVYNGTLPAGFTAMAGTTDPASDNYGNYQYSDGSIMCFTPKFYYRIGSTSSPRYAVYGLNAIDIEGVSTFADETAANAAGYALHRAFIDGGSVKSGFFIDKYLCSKNGTTSGKSVKNGDPISLTTNATYNPSSTMTGCTGILADAVVLSRARGAGTFNVASIFMYSALALLSLAHGQAATATTYCAWYDATLTTNFPKGCNNGALADVNDTSVTFTVSGISPKPLTGSASNLAKTAHNGQNSGVIDLNGAMYQTMLGLTDFGTTAIDTTTHTNGNVYVLKTTTALASLTAGWDGATDAWGNTAHLALLYDAVAGLLPWGATTGWLYMGNGANQVLDEASSGIGYQRTCCGIPQDTSALSAAGTNGFGNDGQYQINKANLFPLASGSWGYAANAGVFCRSWSGSRSGDNLYYGFRASAYGL